MAKGARFCLTAVLVVCFGCFAAAREPLSVVTDIWPPFRIEAPGSPRGISGIDMDLLDALERRTGFKFAVCQHPWSRALELVRTGAADIIMGLAFSDERDSYIRYVPTSYASVKPAVYVKKGEEKTIRVYEDLRGRMIGQSPKTVYFEPFDSDTRLRKVTIPTEDQILLMLSLGRIDAAIGTEPNIQWDILRLGLRGSLVPAEYQPTKETRLYIGMSRRSIPEQLARTLDAALRDLIAAGEIEAIIARYR